jgi:anti-sigma regulatory factor (Ser/Thr protein kinase)
MCRERAQPEVSIGLELELAAAPETVPNARSAVSELCDQLAIEDDVAERVRITVTEACANCVQHAYRGAPASSTYMLETRIEDHALVVIVHDCGVGMIPSKNAGLGLGLRLIEELADSAEVSSRPGHGTRVEMRFAAHFAAV